MMENVKSASENSDKEGSPPTDEEPANKEESNKATTTSFSGRTGWSIKQEESRGDDAGSVIIAEKAVLSSPFSSPARTSVSSVETRYDDEENREITDKEYGRDAEGEDRRRKMIVAMACLVFLIVLLPLLVTFVGHSKQRSSNIPVTLSPTTSNQPSFSPSNKPSFSPTLIPTSSPSSSPTDPPFALFTYGDSFYTNSDLDIQISVGLTVKRIAQTGSRVTYADGVQSSISYHAMMDGAGMALLPDGGYAYISNSEVENNGGGVYGLYFNKEGEITNYKALLTGTSRNCAGGMSPWDTWISCEEVKGGQCWQIEPNMDNPNHDSPKVTLLGGTSGGSYESVAVDNTNQDKPIFFVTEDTSDGELRRFEADGNGWNALHVGGKTTYLQFLDGGRFQWTSSLSAGQDSASSYYPNTEGITYHNNTLYFVSKVLMRLFILDLKGMTYTSEQTGSSYVGMGDFNSQPDQIIPNDMDKRKYIYFTEDGGNRPGIHVRDREGRYYTMVRAIPGDRYSGDETVGIAFSPDRRRFHFGFQDAGVLMEVTRDDGQPFD